MGSYQNQRYCLRDGPGASVGLEAARAYLRFDHPEVNLRENYLEAVGAVTEQLRRGVPVEKLLGKVDVPKVYSSLRLFEKTSLEEKDMQVNRACKDALKFFIQKDRSCANGYNCFSCCHKKGNM
uniref:Uncharacterized protein n=1 Tax=Chromera velia CCMP2878 TaxID=1169474 RepID=A0A0G4GR98_9ALVE|eukprot:Cvel_23028.t1-p1 / transcript=Cvel_23028.t1 / gene=Cvel_23028 / organism=Chromera_velia_CCMP2878 / gene_product=hypothetical protein / transcript_product=hypothetical protein / location=Cvel_scaffold2327:6699-7143(+) / protein_length=123 / sequence_SO=supercontig / SO=protein_coding / is_pseudo=false